MIVIDDLVAAANEYPTTSVVLEIVDVTFPGTAINSLEEGTFRVKVTNRGPLEIDNLRLTISGENGIQIKGNSVIATYGRTLDLHMRAPVPPHSTVDANTGPDFGFKAPSSSWSDQKVLIKATLDEFDVSVESMLSDLKGPSPALKWTYQGP
jgi:hypothetical protein